MWKTSALAGPIRFQFGCTLMVYFIDAPKMHDTHTKLNDTHHTHGSTHNSDARSARPGRPYSSNPIHQPPGTLLSIYIPVIRTPHPTRALVLHPNSTGAAAPCFPAALIAASRDLSIYGLTFTFMHVFCSMLCFCFCFDSVARSFLPRPRGARALLPRFSLRRRHTHTPATRDAIPKNPTPNPYYPNPETPRLAPLRRPARA